MTETTFFLLLVVVIVIAAGIGASPWGDDDQ